jgi:hypothetical protein
MTACVLALTALLAAGGLRVETGTPAALCPDIGEVRRAVRERLNVEGGGEWLASYDLVHRPEAQSGDVVRVELRDPAGKLRLRRDLPRSGESCVALAQAVALVLESFFRHPTSEQPDDEQPDDDAGGPAAPPAIAAAPARPAALGWGPAVELLGAWAAGPSGPALAVDVWYGAGPLSPWAFGLEGVWMATEKRLTIELPSSAQATAATRSALFRGWVARRLRVAEPVELLLGPELVLGLDRFQPQSVPMGVSDVRAAPGVGGRAHLRLRLASRIALSLVAALDVTPPSLAGRFEIDVYGVPAEVFPAPSVRLFVGAGIALALFQ